MALDAPEAPGHLGNCHLPSPLLGSEHPAPCLGEILSQVSLSSARGILKLPGNGVEKVKQKLDPNCWMESWEI